MDLCMQNLPGNFLSKESRIVKRSNRFGMKDKYEGFFVFALCPPAQKSSRVRKLLKRFERSKE